MGFRIGIDAHAAERDGSGNCTYIRNLLLGLASIDRENIYFLYAINPQHPFFNKLKIYENFQIKPLLFKNPFWRIPFSLALRTYLDKIDLLHVQYIAPPFHRGKLVVTIHDLAHFVIPWSFSRFEVLRSKLLIPFSARKAQKILTGSNYAARSISEKLNIPFAKIAITPYGVNPELLKPLKLRRDLFQYDANHKLSNRELDELLCNQKIENSKKAEELKIKYGLNPPYILSLSRINPRKNFSILVKAFEILKIEKNISHQLVIVGKADFRASEIKKMAESSPWSRDIVFTGYVPDEDLIYLYAWAEVFVFLSEYEGFGLPAIEAMASGTPTIVYASTSLPEVAGEAALYVNELNPLIVAEKIGKLLEDKELQGYLKQKGLERAKLYSWKETARLTLEVYKKVLHRKNN